MDASNVILCFRTKIPNRNLFVNVKQPSSLSIPRSQFTVSHLCFLCTRRSMFEVDSVQ